MPSDKTVELLEKVRHELCFLGGLKAFDAVCPEKTFTLDFLSLRQEVDAEISRLSGKDTGL